jgi:hypothetical protein
MSKFWRSLAGIGLSVAGAVVLALPAQAQTNCNASVGPDIIVGDITGPTNYTAAGGFDALSLGTYSCNIGTVWANWFSGTNQHPVIGGTLYRYHTVDGVTRFEHVGRSWLKHGFFALSNNLCCSGCQGTDGTHLGVKCADPYTAARNGSQSGLGPRWQVNAWTGVFNYPPANPSWSGGTARRLEVLESELVAGNRYFGECVYVTQDDAAAGNQHNNASYREISYNAGTFGFVGSTQREKPAVRAWPLIDPGVQQVDVTVPGEGGRLILSSKVTDIGGGEWAYEYNLYNQNSDLSVGSFSIPVNASLNVMNIGFHDTDYRWNDGPGNVNYSGTDWPGNFAGGAVGWATQTFAQNQSANAIRWASAHNFRFVCNAPPTSGSATIGLFKNGSSTTAITQVPSGNTPAGTPFCAGDGGDPGVTVLCPCFNLGAPGKGCDNSAATGGAQLASTGSPALDTVVLTSSGELPTALSIFLQGNALATGGVLFGDGVRCVGGSLKRLYVKNAVGGTVSAPQGAEPSIQTQSASLGDPIAPGSTRWYQVYYRDPDLSFCPSPGGDSFNISSGQVIVW